MDIRTFLSNEVKPALGCTEPGAVALATSWAAKHGEGPVRSITLRLSPNIFKNGLHAGIPGTEGGTGNLLAAALGALKGDPEKGLTALDGVSAQDVADATDLVNSGVVTQTVVPDVPSVYVEAELADESGTITVIISGRHDRVVQIRKNGRVVKKLLEAESDSGGRLPYIEELLAVDMEGLWELAGGLDDEEVRFLLDGSRMNMEVAEQGLSRSWGLGIGFNLMAL
ncbi:MAG TPA: serine dehydratase subunit alpha family protein, partial [Synergistales bacterium]|nr:serine dehydratase subunit alpha family protein [Synergistales bacterium]